MSDIDPTPPVDPETTATTTATTTTTVDVGPPTTDTSQPDTGQPDPDGTSGPSTTIDEEPTSTVEPPAPSTRSMSDRGISVELPPGWEGEIYRRAPGDVTYDAAVPRARQLQPTTRSVVHLGSFPLPPDRGDYGSGAVEIMRDEDVLVVLFEFEPESATEVMFAQSGVPHPLAPGDFDPNQLQRPLEGMAGVQRFFNVDEQRSFCLYVVIGSFARRRELIGQVNEVLAGISLEA